MKQYRCYSCKYYLERKLSVIVFIVANTAHLKALKSIIILPPQFSAALRPFRRLQFFFLLPVLLMQCIASDSACYKHAHNVSGRYRCGCVISKSPVNGRTITLRGQCFKRNIQSVPAVCVEVKGIAIILNRRNLCGVTFDFRLTNK